LTPLFIIIATTMSRYPVPFKILEELDTSDLDVYGQAHVSQRVENRRLIAEVTTKINTIYDSGAFFFIKDAIRDIARQLDQLTPDLTWEEGVTASLKFNTQGIDGVWVEVPVELGEVLRYRDRLDVDIV